MNNKIEVSRDHNLLNEVLLVDGQPGCGKSLFSSIVSSFEKLEIMQYSSIIENICALFFLKKISSDAVSSIAKIELDLLIYETMMGRNTNFRFNDLSSAFNNNLFFKYFFRLFSEGDSNIPSLIYKKKPILHLATHSLLAFTEPLILSLKNKIKILEVVRHPLYMVIQQSLNHEKWSISQNTARQFHLYIKTKNGYAPYYTSEWEVNFFNLNPTERAIYDMAYHFNKTNLFKKQNTNSNILTIPFELFVRNPFPWIKDILNWLNVRPTAMTKKIIKKQKIPRKKIADGISLEIYKKCGWQPSRKDLSEVQELDIRRDFVIKQKVSKEALKLLDTISEKYEKKYLGNFL